MKYRIGTRDSKLALTQTKIVCDELLKNNPNLSSDQFEIVPIKTLGDKILSKNLIDFGGKNLFIKEIEEALANNVIDFAVHSLKDMTANLNERFVIASFLEREDPRDALVSLKYKSLEEVPINALMGTSSIRRKYLTLNKRDDLNIVPFRGNVLRRLDKLKEGQVAATFLAMAGLNRLAIEPDLYVPLDVENFIPAVCQGIIGVECRKNDENIRELLSSINHYETEICARAERGFLEFLDASCETPIGAYASLDNAKVNLDSMVVDKEGKIRKYKLVGEAISSEKIGIEAGKNLKSYL